MCCENYDGPEKSPNQNNLVAEKPLVRQNIFRQKYVPKRFGRKKFCAEKNVGKKRNLAIKRFWDQN